MSLPHVSSRWWHELPHIVQFSAPQRVEVVEQSPLPLKAGHVRIRTRFSGISAGTELTAYRGTNPYLNRTWDPEARLFLDGSTGLTYPLGGLGYSEVGEVIEVADDVPGLPDAPALGEQVWGIWGHRSEAVLPADKLRGHALHNGLNPVAATFVRVGSTALNAVLAADIHLTETVAVFGQGVLGLLTTKLASLSGARVAAVDTITRRLEKARQYGASILVDATDGTAAPQLRRLTDNRGVDVAIEISGSYVALHEAIRSVAVDGRVVAAGFYQGDAIGLRLGDEFHHNRVHIVASQIGGLPAALAGRWDQARLNRSFLELAGTGVIDPVGLVSHVVPASQAADAYELLDKRPQDVLQVVLEF